jgi:hypothetical protein
MNGKEKEKREREIGKRKGGRDNQRENRDSVESV